MAPPDSSKPGFLSRLDARGRIVLLVVAIIGVVVAIYFVSRYFTGSSNTVGPSNVAPPPRLQSIPGGVLTPEYQKEVIKYNRQTQEGAVGGKSSSQLTMLNTGYDQTDNPCNVICSDQNANVKYLLNDLVKKGLPQDVADTIQKLADQKVSVTEFANQLDKLVKAGKLTPAQARDLLEAYKKQHANELLQDSAASMDQLIKSGKLPLDVASQLLAAQKNNMSPLQYGALLDQLVKEGKISPETAKKLLDDYTQQRTGEAAKDAIAGISQMASAGLIPPDVATELTNLAKRGASVADYQAALERDVAAGKISPEVAAKLLADYKAQMQKALMGAGPGIVSGDGQLQGEGNAPALVTQIADKANAKLNDDLDRLNTSSINQAAIHDINNASKDAIDNLVKSGKLSALDAAGLKSLVDKNVSPEEYAAAVNNLVKQGKLSAADASKLIDNYQSHQQLKDLVNRNVSPAEYEAAVNRMVAEGKLSPEEAKRLIGNYQAQQTLKDLAAQNVSPEEYTAAVNKLVSEGKLSQQDADQLVAKYKTAQDVKALSQSNLSPAEYAAKINQMVAEGKLTPAEGKQLIADYKAAKNANDEMRILQGMQTRNASPEEYKAELQRAVQAGILTPQQAQQLMQEYRAIAAAKNPASTVGTAPGPGGVTYGRQAGQRTAQPAGATAADFERSQIEAQQQHEKEEQDRIAALSGAMSARASGLISFWAPPVQSYRGGNTDEERKAAEGRDHDKDRGREGGSGGSSENKPNAGPVLIKSGTIIFAVLDTAVNSDYPDSPVLATIVTGPYKGAKLLGRLTTSKSPAGQLDRIGLLFNLMNLDVWPTGKAINAYAIDPDTARTVLASSVNYHYLQRYGAIMATSFLQGYAAGVTNEGTSQTGIFGTSTSHPGLSPGQKLAVALGQIGTNLGTVTQGYVNIPPTVKVDSGVSLGILFMTDVS